MIRGLSILFCVLATLGFGVSTAGASAVHSAIELDAQEVECLALTIYWEARGQPVTEQDAVAYVALNRLNDDAFPDTVCGVVKQGGTERYRCQFHWWCDGRSDEPTDMTAWRRAKARAKAALLRRSPDPTHGAVYFHHSRTNPSWSSRLERTAKLGPHIFYR